MQHPTDAAQHSVAHTENRAATRSTQASQKKEDGDSTTAMLDLSTTAMVDLIAAITHDLFNPSWERHASYNILTELTSHWIRKEQTDITTTATILVNCLNNRALFVLASGDTGVRWA